MSVPKVAATIFIGVGLGLLVYFGDQAIQAVLSSSWPTVEGVVTESKVIQRIGRRNRKTDFPTITYYYSVDGVGHIGTRLFFGSQYLASWTTGAKWTSDGKEYIARYPKGTLLQVHYDPDDAATYSHGPVLPKSHQAVGAKTRRETLALGSGKVGARCR